jgi:flagellar basal body L-ring protein FlgH
MEKEIKNDPENYRKMREPFENLEKANEAIENFYDELFEIRKKYNISDILIVIKDSCKYADGKIGTFMQCLQYGNSLNGKQLAAYAYGQMQANDREMINKLLAGQMKLNCEEK